jgi:hypothetical protein
MLQVLPRQSLAVINKYRDCTTKKKKIDYYSIITGNFSFQF